MRPSLLVVGVLASTPAFAFPLDASGTFCDRYTCQDVTATFEANGGGRLIAQGMGYALQWRRTGRDFELLVDQSVFQGTVSGACVSGSSYYTLGAYSSPIPYEWQLCVDAP